jgi:DNA modification methylase
MCQETKLDGKTWMRYSISVWDDIKKSPDERSIGHPAMYPVELARRLLQCYFWDETGVVLDPFLGSGSTLIAAAQEGLSGVGFEVVPHIAEAALHRMKNLQLPLLTPRTVGPPKLEVEHITEPRPISFSPEVLKLILVQADARHLLSYLQPSTVDIVVTSPPYWNIHARARSVDRKQPRPYSDLAEDLGNIDDYQVFLRELARVFEAVFAVLKPGAYCIVNVMDLRQGHIFVPYHVDVIRHLTPIGFRLEDIIIWNRAHEYNNLRPIGYPHKFIINKVHEYILVFSKSPSPKGEADATDC